MKSIKQILFSLFSTKHKLPEKKVSKPTNLLSYKEIATMLTHYDNTKMKALTESLGKEDSRVINIPIEQLKNYIAYVEKLSREKSIEVTSLNFIMASYPDDYKVDELKGFQTLFYLPATSINGEERVSFDPLYSTKGTPKLFRDILQKYNYTWRYDSKKQSDSKKSNSKQSNAIHSKSMVIDEESSAGNRNHLSPPL